MLPSCCGKDCKDSSCSVNPVLALKRLRCVLTVEEAMERIEPISFIRFSFLCKLNTQRFISRYIIINVHSKAKTSRSFW